MNQQSKSGAKSVIIFGCFGLATALIIYAVFNFSEFKAQHLSAEQKFMRVWSQDVEMLIREKFAHAGFNDLKEVKLIPTNERLKKMYQENPVDFHTKPDGKYTLEVFVDEMEDGDGVLVQYNIVELASGNTIWELSRGFPNKLPVSLQ